MEFYILKRVISKLINEAFYYIKKILRKGKSFLKFLFMILIIVAILYFCKSGGFSYGR